MENITKHLVAVLVVVAFIVGGYFLFSRVDLLAGVADRSASIEEKTVTLEREVLTNINRLKEIQLNTTLFDTEEYQQLEDISTALPQPKLSRKNPFKPIGD